MAKETVTEIIVNLKSEIQKYAAMKNHTHVYLDEAITTLTNKFNDYWVKEGDDGILAYLNNNYYKKAESDTHNDERYAPKSHLNDDASKTVKGHTKVAEEITDTETNPVQGKAIVSYVNTKLSGIQSDTFAHPTQTTTKIDSLLAPGYYLYVGNADTFNCKPDNIQYKNGLIRVEKQSNHIIQHVYSTSWSKSGKKYKIDGREFVRHGYTSTKNDKIVGNWYPWHVSHLPWRKRNDLLIKPGTGVNGTFDLYESTAGYTFRWIQGGSNHQYNLHMPQYQYATIYTFKELPIFPQTIGNLVGHMDVRINSTSFNLRSVNKKGEHIIGMDVTYFIPRTN